MSMFDMTEVIEDSITDATAPEPDSSVEAAADDSADTSASSDETPADDPNLSPAASERVAAAAVPDAFAKEHGLQPQLPGQRENRIPYSRVKAISDSAVKKALTPVQTELATTKQQLTQYEQRLEQVGQFEQILANDPEKFLNMLTTIPAYREIFTHLQAAAAKGMAAQNAQQPAPGAPGTPPVDDGMPQPNADGQYDMDGLKALLNWNASQVEARVTKTVENRYKPIEQQWQAQRQIEELAPKVQRQIDDARKWPKFTENEAAITAAIAADRSLTLDGAYRQVVLPTIVADRDKMRNELLTELKKAPTSTSSPAGGMKPGMQVQGPRSIEDIIKDSIQGLPGR